MEDECIFFFKKSQACFWQLWFCEVEDEVSHVLYQDYLSCSPPFCVWQIRYNMFFTISLIFFQSMFIPFILGSFPLCIGCSLLFLVLLSSFGSFKFFFMFYSLVLFTEDDLLSCAGRLRLWLDHGISDFGSFLYSVCVMVWGSFVWVIIFMEDIYSGVID